MIDKYRVIYAPKDNKFCIHYDENEKIKVYKRYINKEDAVLACKMLNVIEISK